LNSIAVSWVDNATNETGYNIQWAQDAAFTTGVVNRSVGANVTTFNTGALALSTNFYFRVQAVNGATTSAWVNATPFPIIITPSAPPLAPSSVTVAIAASPLNSITVSWVDNATNETGYSIQWATDSAFSIGVMNGTVAAGITTFNTGALALNTNFYFRVQAVNGATTSAWVNATPFPIIITPSVLPLAPSSVTAVNAFTGTTRRATITWVDNATNETGYRIQRATNIGFTNGLSTVTVGANIQTFTTGTLQTNTSYYFRVQAYNASGSSAWVNATPFPLTNGLTAPIAPSNVQAVNTNTPETLSVNVTWTDNATNETGYRIQRATNSTFTTGLVTKTVGANTTIFNTGNLNRRTNYYFRVQAYNAAGPSAYVNATPFPILTP
jgi:hypothetical protein